MSFYTLEYFLWNYPIERANERAFSVCNRCYAIVVVVQSIWTIKFIYFFIVVLTHLQKEIFILSIISRLQQQYSRLPLIAQNFTPGLFMRSHVRFPRERAQISPLYATRFSLYIKQKGSLWTLLIIPWILNECSIGWPTYYIYYICGAYDYKVDSCIVRLLYLARQFSWSNCPHTVKE